MQHKQQLSSAASYVRSTGAGVSACEFDRSLACFSCQPREMVKRVKLFVNTQKKRHRMIKLKTKFLTTVFLNCGVRESKSTKGQNGVAFVGTMTTTRCDKSAPASAHGRNHPPHCTLRGPLLCFPSVRSRRCPALAACWHKREQQSVRP